MTPKEAAIARQHGHKLPLFVEVNAVGFKDHLSLADGIILCGDTVATESALEWLQARYSVTPQSPAGLRGRLGIAAPTSAGLSATPAFAAKREKS